MNNKGSNMGIVGKILLMVVLVLTLFSCFNNILIGLSTNSLVRLISPNSSIVMRIIYTLIGLSTLVTAIWLFIKAYIE